MIEYKPLIDYLTSVIGLLSVALPIIIGGLVWLHKTYMSVRDCQRVIKELSDQFKPNGGSSLRDAINRIEHKVAQIDLTQKTYLDIDSAHPIFQTDHQGHVIWANRAYTTLVERPIEEILGTGWELIVPQNERDKIRDEWYRACAENRSFEYCFHYVNARTYDKKAIKCKSYGSDKSGYVGVIYEVEEC